MNIGLMINFNGNYHSNRTEVKTDLLNISPYNEFKKSVAVFQKYTGKKHFS